MGSTTIVKAPVIAQGSDITVTAPSVTSIPAGYYDGTENITANSNGTSLYNSGKLFCFGGDGFDKGTDTVAFIHNGTNYFFILCGMGRGSSSSSINNDMNFGVYRINKTTQEVDGGFWQGISADIGSISGLTYVNETTGSIVVETVGGSTYAVINRNSNPITVNTLPSGLTLVTTNKFFNNSSDWSTGSIGPITYNSNNYTLSLENMALGGSECLGSTQLLIS